MKILYYLFLMGGMFTTVLAQPDIYNYDPNFKNVDSPFSVPALFNAETQVYKSSALTGTWSKEFSIPGIVGRIHSSATDGENLYIGGNFQIAGGTYAKNIVMWNGQKWSSLGVGAENGVTGWLGYGAASVEAIALSDGKVFIGGQVNGAGSLTVNGIAYWDGSQWNSLGKDSLNGVRRYYIHKEDTIIGSGHVQSLFVYENKLYVGGDFDLAGDKPSKGVAIWNMETEEWESLKGGFRGKHFEHEPVYAYAFAAKDDKLFVGGKFDSAGGVPAQNLAIWDGSNWTAMGEAAGYIYDLEFDSKGNLHAVGYFPSFEAPSITGIGTWNGMEWKSLEGPDGFNCNADRILIHNDIIYVAGLFENEETVPDHSLAAWDGNSWEFITGLGQTSNEFLNGGGAHMQVINGKLYLGGDFTYAGNNYLVNIAAWNIAEKYWDKLDDGTGNRGIHAGGVSVLEKSTDGIYAGGSFTVAGNEFARNVAKLTQNGWQSIGKDYDNGVRGTINCVLADGDDLYVGGYFGSAGSVEAYHVARWDGSDWHSLGIGVGGVNGASVNALAKIGDYLYVGGYFSMVGDDHFDDQPANSIARFNLKTSRWEALGNGIEIYEGLPGVVYHLEAHGNQVLVAGQFNFADRKGFENIAALTDGKWSGFEENNEVGITGIVRVITKINDDIFIGGILLPLGYSQSAGILKWNGKKWVEIGDTLSIPYGNIFVNDIEPYKEGFIAGGHFSHIGEMEVNNLAYYDGTTWFPVANGVQPLVSSVKIMGQQLFVGGPEELFMEEATAFGIARFDLHDIGTSVSEEIPSVAPTNLKIYPNPFSLSATIRFQMPKPGKVSITVLNMQGKILSTLLEGFRENGEHIIEFSGNNLSNGFYLVRIIQNNSVETIPVILSR